METASSVLDSAKTISDDTEAQLKALTKRLKAKFAVNEQPQQPQPVDEEEDEDAKSIKAVLSSFSKSVKQKVTSERGLETLRSGVGAQFQQILEDAQREVGGGGVEVPESDVLARMSTILDKVLSQVDSAGAILFSSLFIPKITAYCSNFSQYKATSGIIV